MRRLAVLLAFVCSASAFAQHFRNPVRIPVSDMPATVLSGDLNGDGRVDLLAVSGTTLGSFDVRLHVLLAQTSGAFTETSTVTVTASSHCLLADVNRDSHLDVVCGNSSNAVSTLAVVLGKGDGTFGAPLVSPLTAGTFNTGISYGTGAFTFLPLAVADVNGDGNPDLLLGTLSPGSVTVMLGDRMGHFLSSTTTITFNATRSIDVTDLNGDGYPDVVAEDYGSTVVLPGRADGSFPTVHYYGFGGFLADADQDGHPDLLGISTDGLVFYHGNTDGTFNKTPFFTQRIPPDSNTGQQGRANLVRILAYGDRNHDGIPDLLVSANNGMTTLVGKAGPRFTTLAHAPDATFGVFPSYALPTWTKTVTSTWSPQARTHCT